MSDVAEMVGCSEHRRNDRDGCLSCEVAVDWNIWRKFCACGVPAIGYVIRAREDVGFYCDEHYEDVRSSSTPHEEGS